MSILADSVTGYLEHASWIRRMFEAGGQLKARYGADKVYDFSLGNPDLPAPPALPGDVTTPAPAPGNVELIERVERLRDAVGGAARIA